MMFSKHLKRLGLVLLAASTSFCAGSEAFREAHEEELLHHWDVAVLKYTRAVQMDPHNGHYKIALSQAKLHASQFHFEKGKIYRSSGHPELAVVELEEACVLDPTNQYAQTELKKAQDEARLLAAERSGDTRIQELKRKARGARAHAPILEPASDKPINLNFPQPRPIKQIYQALASAAGINVIFDPQFKDDNVSIVLTNIQFQNALETLMRQENHFYKVIDEHTILIAADTPANRKTYEDLVLRTFYLSNGDITDVSNALRNLLQTTRIYPNKAENSITIRDTADKVAIAEKIIDQNDKQLAEVVIDVELLQVDSDKMQEIGVALSSYSVGVSLPAPGGTTDLGVALPGSSSTGGGQFTFDQLGQITKRSFGFTLPAGATINFIKNNTDAELLAKPQIRISEGQKAQLIIGDKQPIPTTSFSTSNTVGGSIVPLTSFQYQDVGIKIEVEPRVHHNKEVTLKLALEVSQISGFTPATAGTAALPIIGTRTISSNIRLKDGETNFLAGLYQNVKTIGNTTIPFVGDIPVLGRLFTNKKAENKSTDLVLTLTPHIIRIPDITEEDLAPLYVGTDQNISFAGTPRIETPGVAGPFDYQRPAAPPPPPNRSVTPAPINLAPVAPPSDIFRPPLNQVPPQPAPTPVPQPFGQAVAVPVDGGPSSGSAAAQTIFDLDPTGLVIPAGQQRAIVVRATGQGPMTDATLSIRFDPAIVAATSARAILADAGQADARVESGRVVISIPSTVNLSGTQTVAEIVLLGIKPGKTALMFDAPSAGSSSVVEVR
jgi:general secretion pathway protein D